MTETKVSSIYPLPVELAMATYWTLSDSWASKSREAHGLVFHLLEPGVAALHIEYAPGTTDERVGENAASIMQAAAAFELRSPSARKPVESYRNRLTPHRMDSVARTANQMLNEVQRQSRG